PIAMARLENSIPIKGFLDTSFLDWPGKIASVIFLPSCNFRCPFCQNADLVLNPQRLKTWPLPDVLQRIEELKDWIDGVCITGGEPTLQKTLPDFIRIFKKRNLLVKLDTNGSNPQMIETLLKENLVDAIAMDVKAPLEEISYARLTGVPVDLKAIKKSIDLIRKSSIEKIFRITVVPKMLTEEDIYRVAEELYPVTTSYHVAFKSRSRRRRGIDAGVRFSTSRSMTRRQQRYANEGDVVLVLQQFSPENTLDSKLKHERPWSQEKLEQVQRQVDQLLISKQTKRKAES
ncbi:MAG TPA: anaerobic ribonucleoside-triphosphate reductase activating protein, partial [Thermodesulfobacteriota bacterium]|nr:anaerobic ribonucleoside-triphosphate reductase activating protein [Thermodesulfobacteriota bacterium]